jgi:nucleoid DNA-binding protein
MTYQDLLAQLSDETRYTRRELRYILRALARLIKDHICSGSRVIYTGLGVFRNIEAGPWSGRNPVTGDRILVPAKRRVTFKGSRDFKARLEKTVNKFKDPDIVSKYLPKGRSNGKVRSTDRPKETGTTGEGKAGWKKDLFRRSKSQRADG